MSEFAFFFPGQGSQSVGMMDGLAGIDVVTKTFQEASDILGVDFWKMVTEPNEDLNATENTQPLMLTAGIATWRAYLAASDSKPTVMAGHSLGEYSALVAAEALSFADALPLVKFRAQAMQNAVPAGQGAMAAVLGLDDETVNAVCMEAAQGDVLEAVNFNSPGQVVIAGDKAAIDRAIAVASEKGAKRVLPLPVSVPSHCALMQPAAAQLADYLSSVSVQAPAIKVLHNADVNSYDDADKVKDALVRQLYSPVKWVDTIKAVYQLGIRNSAECGPGKVLAGLVKRTEKEVVCTPLISVDAINDFS